MQKETRLEALAREQREFDRQLPDLIRSHPGSFVLFADGAPIEYFPTLDEAYEEALRRFGLERTFLIAKAEPKRDETASIAWYAGVTFA